MESTTIKPGSGWVQNHRQLWLVEELEPDRRGVRLVCWHATSGGGLERQQSHVSVQDLLEGGEWRRASDDEVQELTERLLRTPARDAVAGLQQRGRDAAVAAEGAAVDRERLEARQRAAAERRAGSEVPALDKMLWAGVGESEAAPAPTSAALTADVSPVVVDRGELKDLFFSSPLKEQDMDDEQRRLHEMAGRMHELGEEVPVQARSYHAGPDAGQGHLLMQAAALDAINRAVAQRAADVPVRGHSEPVPDAPGGEDEGRADAVPQEFGVEPGSPRDKYRARPNAPMEERVGIAPPRKVMFEHDYPGAPGNPTDPAGWTSDCRYGCGCYAGPFTSGSRGKSVDPFGECPKHPELLRIKEGLAFRLLVEEQGMAPGAALQRVLADGQRQRRLHELAGHMHEMAGHMHELGERLIYGARELRTLAGATDDTNEG